jgi:alpha-L-fucosidase 2
MILGLLAALALPVWGAPSPEATKVLSDLVYASPGGVALHLDAYLLRGPERHPAVIYVHGGGWTGGSKKMAGMARLLLPVLNGAGFSAFSIEYRLAPAYPYPAALEDVRAAIRYVRAHADELRIAPDRIALAGSSAGGHLVALVGTTPCDGPAGREPAGCGARTIIDLYGPADLRGWVNVPAVRAFLGPRLTSNRKRLLAEASPIANVCRGDLPTLILHGDRDPVVPYAQSAAFQRALQAAGVPSRLVTIPGGSHGTNWTHGGLNWQRDIVRWLRTYL